jgi:hypothetical protein
VQTLWLLFELDAQPHVDLLCLAPHREEEAPARGWAPLTDELLTRPLRRKQEHLLDELFDGQSLRRWWGEKATVMRGFPSLDHPHAVPGIAALDPEVIVFLRPPGVAATLADGLARRVLVARIGNQAVEDAANTVMQAVARERPEYLRSTIQELDAGRRSERCLWFGTPQVAPGDTGEEILLRMTSDLGDALMRCICSNAASSGPAVEAVRDTICANSDRFEFSETAGLRTWLSYLLLGRGRHWRYIYDKAIRC